MNRNRIGTRAQCTRIGSFLHSRPSSGGVKAAVEGRLLAVFCERASPPLRARVHLRKAETLVKDIWTPLCPSWTCALGLRMNQLHGKLP